MPRFETPHQAVVTRKSTTVENFLWFTESLDTTRIETFRLGVDLWGLSGDVEVRFGISFSDDGETFSAVSGIDVVDGGTTHTDSEGWTFMDVFKALSTDYSASMKLFVRFGLLVRNKTGTDAECATARMRIELKAQPGRTLMAPRRLVASSGDDTTEVFYPLLRSIDTESVGSFRATWRRAGNSGDCGTRAGYQTSCDRGVTWSTATGIGTSAATAGFTYGTTFTTTSFGDDELARFGALVKNDTVANTDVEASLFELRVDTRPG